MDDLPPFTHALALCRLGIRFPRKTDGIDVDMSKGPDPSCDALITASEKLKEKGFSEEQSNAYVCYEKIFEGVHMMDTQKSYIHGPGRFIYNHAAKCKTFKKNYMGKVPSL